MLRATPATICKAPQYPSRPEALAHPGLLQKQLPGGWKRSAEVGALAFFLLAANGCIRVPELPPIPKPDTTPPWPAQIRRDKMKLGWSEVESRPTGGIVAISEFQTEEFVEKSTWETIQDEFSKSGIHLTPQPVILAELGRTHRLARWTESVKIEVEELGPEAQRDRYLNALDSEKHIGIELEHAVPYHSANGMPRRGDATEEATGQQPLVYFLHAPVKDDCLFTAPSLGLADLQRETVCAGPERANERAQSRALLRLQIREFLAWLKAQGVM